MHSGIKAAKSGLLKLLKVRFQCAFAFIGSITKAAAGRRDNFRGPCANLLRGFFFKFLLKFTVCIPKKLTIDYSRFYNVNLNKILKTFMTSIDGTANLIIYTLYVMHITQRIF